MKIRPKLIAGIVGLSTLIPAKAQKAVNVVQSAPVVERVAEDTVKVKSKISPDISLRTFQFLNGNNLTALGTGIGGSYKKTYAYLTPLFGYDFGNKQPFVGGCGFLDRYYGNNKGKKVWLSQELYGEVLKEKDVFDSKVAYTPVKVNAMLSKNISLSFDPRLAVHINQNGFTPQMETLTTVSGPIYKNLSGYAIFQTYDTTNLFKEGAINNIGINGGIVYTF